MTFIGLVVGLLAVWRITHLLQAEDGPWDVVLCLRRAAGQGMFGWLLDCFNCLNLWVAAPVALLVGEGAVSRLLPWLALSGGAIYRFAHPGALASVDARDRRSLAMVPVLQQVPAPE